ncbi:hypothetical protein RintRC_5637 [Richelia intracellularis]|nr:hypothetical protein RintRC_5637 [Richelia intracellularis]
MGVNNQSLTTGTGVRIWIRPHRQLLSYRVGSQRWGEVLS